jgi:hypothetical protein
MLLSNVLLTEIEKYFFYAIVNANDCNKKYAGWYLQVLANTKTLDYHFVRKSKDDLIMAKLIFTFVNFPE